MQVDTDSGSFSGRLHYRYLGMPPDDVSPRGDAFLTCLLIPAMQAGEDLHIEAPVSPYLLSHMPRIVSLLRSWDPAFSDTRVTVSSADTHETQAAGTGLFFTGGVDSFYSLLRDIETHGDGPEAVTHLVFVHDYGTRDPYRASTKAKLSAHFKRIAKAAGKELILVETNLRRGPRASWRLHHGSALISTVQPLRHVFGRFLIASSSHMNGMEPWGTHPALDHLWSLEDLEIVHDGVESYRTEKMRTHVAHSDLALSSLRVCWREEHQPQNCGRCRKCVQAMIVLHTLGKLDECPVFAHPLTLWNILRMNLEGRRWGTWQHLELLRGSPGNHWRALALRLAIARHDLTELVAVRR
jgi:hypothetical protein